MKSITLFFKNLTIGKSLLLSISPVLMIILDMQTTILALGIIIFIDMLTGIRKSLHLKGIKVKFYKKEFWQAINSSGLRATWRKTYEYGVGVLVFTILDGMVLGTTSLSLLGQAYSISELAVTIACLVEVYSVYENMEAVSGNNLFKKMIKIFPQRVKSIFSNIKKDV